MPPSTAARVPKHTYIETNKKIEEQTQRNIAYYSSADHSEIESRLKELDREWDMERLLQTNASVVALFGLVLATTVRWKFIILPMAVMGFLLQHAVQGWCPPVSLFRRLGVRTSSEINSEKYALKALRGDFAAVPQTQGIQKAREAFRATSR